MFTISKVGFPLLQWLAEYRPLSGLPSTLLDFSTLLWKPISLAGNTVLEYRLLSPMLDMLVMCSTPPLPLRTFNATR